MSQRIVSNLKDSVAGLLSGLDVNQVDNLYGAFERSARLLIQKAKIPETQGTQNIMLYDGVTDYLIDPRIFGTNVLDIRPQGISRWRGDFVYKKFGDDFDRMKQIRYLGTYCTFDYSNGTPIIRIVSSITKQRNILDLMNDVTGWTANASLTNLTADPSFFYQTPASLRFNLANAGSQGTLTKTINSLDLTAYKASGVAFLAVELPTTNFTSFELRIGSSASNYYTITNTTGTLGFVTGQFMLVAFDMSLATIVGTPDISKITYLFVGLNYNGTAQTNVRVGNLFISLPSPMQILYGSAGFFRIGSVVSTSITTDNDEIILNDSAYTIYELECALAILQQTGGGKGDSMIAQLESQLNGVRARTGAVISLGLYDLYKADNPSGVLKVVGSYYDTDNSYGGGYNGRS